MLCFNPGRSILCSTSVNIKDVRSLVGEIVVDDNEDDLDFDDVFPFSDIFIAAMASAAPATADPIAVAISRPSPELLLALIVVRAMYCCVVYVDSSIQGIP